MYGACQESTVRGRKNTPVVKFGVDRALNYAVIKLVWSCILQLVSDNQTQDPKTMKQLQVSFVTSNQRSWHRVMESSGEYLLLACCFYFKRWKFSYRVGTGTSVRAPNMTACCSRTKAMKGLSKKSTSPTSTLEASASRGNFFMNLFFSCVSERGRKRKLSLVRQANRNVQ